MILAAVLSFLAAKMMVDVVVPVLFSIDHTVQRALFWAVLLCVFGWMHLLEEASPDLPWLARHARKSFREIMRLSGWAALALVLLAPVSCATRSSTVRTVEPVGEWQRRDTRLDCTSSDCWDVGWCGVHPVVRDLASGDVFRVELPRHVAQRDRLFPYRRCDQPAPAMPLFTTPRRVRLEQDPLGLRRRATAVDVMDDLSAPRRFAIVDQPRPWLFRIGLLCFLASFVVAAFFWKFRWALGLLIAGIGLVVAGW